MKSGNPFPTCLFGGTRRHPPNFTLRQKPPKISRFRYFRGKKRKNTIFGREKRKKTQKTQNFGFFYEKWPIWATFFSKIVPRFFPGSCPVLARFLPGSCPVLARFLPGSARFSSSFLGIFQFFGFFRPFLFGTRKNHKKSEIFDRKEKNQQNSEIFARNAKDRKTRKVARISLVWVNKTQKLHVLSCG